MTQAREDVRRVVHGRRRGRPLRAKRAALLNEMLPSLAISLPASGGPLDLAEAFGSDPGELWLEIGFGAGEHLAAQAAAHPSVAMIGCEVFVNGIASMLRHIEAAGLTNIRVFDDDARLLLDALPDSCLHRVYVLFPDPWPKSRHWKRRFLAPATVTALARTMADHGQLVVASDAPAYIRWSLEQLRARDEFAWRARGPGDWRNRPADQPPTRYETKARGAGRRCVYLVYRRRRRDAAPCPETAR